MRIPSIYYNTLLSQASSIKGGMVHDVFSCLCLHHASHTVMQYSVSSCVAFGIEFFLMVVEPKGVCIIITLTQPSSHTGVQSLLVPVPVKKSRA